LIGMNNSKPRADFVSILEAIYSLERPADTWLKQIMLATAPALDEGVGVGGLLYRLGDDPPITLDLIDAIGVPEGWIEVGAAIYATPELQPQIKHAYETMLWADNMELVRRTPNTEVVETYREQWQIRGDMFLNGCDVSGAGACLHFFSRAPLEISVPQRKLLTRLATHLATGYRLHRRLRAREPSAGVEAVLTPRGRVEHVEGAANNDEARANLKVAVDMQRLARGRARKETPDQAIALWQGLVTGRWTLVDRYESDGKRYIVARENTPLSNNAQPLSDREKQVVALASLGRSNKLIAYELGIAHATVRVLFARAARKLGVQTRLELIARFQQSAGSGASR
jgi:DNA-binding CsgD family transcriptional regulator